MPEGEGVEVAFSPDGAAVVGAIPSFLFLFLDQNDIFQDKEKNE